MIKHKYNYLEDGLHIQCQDDTGKIGTFYRDKQGKQISPTFLDCIEALTWEQENE